MNETKEEKTRHLFWPALLLLLLLLAPVHMVRVQAASDQSTVELKLSQGIRRYDYAYQVLDLVNQERAKKNRNPVTMDKNLLECAMTRAEELTVYASHTRPNGSICFSAFPYFEDPSENLAINQGTPEEVMESWIESSGKLFLPESAATHRTVISTGSSAFLLTQQKPAHSLPTRMSPLFFPCFHA